MRSNDELLKQCQLSRTLAGKCSNDGFRDKDMPLKAKENSEKASYAETVQTSMLVFKPTTNTKMSKDQIADKMSQALGKVKVTSAKVTENGKIVVNIPNTECHSKVKESLSSTFSNNFCFEENKTIMPKITITGVPA